MSFIFSLHAIQLKPKVSKQLLASSSRYVHISVTCSLLPYTPYTVYVGLGPAQETKQNHMSFIFSLRAIQVKPKVSKQLLASSSRTVHI